MKVIEYPEGKLNINWNKWIVYDDEMKDIADPLGDANLACYSNLQKFVNKDNIIDLHCDLNLIRYDNNEIIAYINLLNKLPFFKLTCYFDDTRVYFRINCKDYPTRNYFVAIGMCIRYLWGDFVGDNTSFIPYFFINLCKKNPNEDVLYNLLLAHVHLNFPTEFKKDFVKYGDIRNRWNSNHTLVIKHSSPIRLKNLKEHTTSTNYTFSYRSDGSPATEMQTYNSDKEKEHLKKLYEENIRCWK